MGSDSNRFLYRKSPPSRTGQQALATKFRGDSDKCEKWGSQNRRVLEKRAGESYLRVQCLEESLCELGFGGADTSKWRRHRRRSRVSCFSGKSLDCSTSEMSRGHFASLSSPSNSAGTTSGCWVPDTRRVDNNSCRASSMRCVCVHVCACVGGDYMQEE